MNPLPSQGRLRLQPGATLLEALAMKSAIRRLSVCPPACKGTWMQGGLRCCIVAWEGTSRCTAAQVRRAFKLRTRLLYVFTV